MNPYWLLIVATDGRIAQIDLDERGWLTTYAEFMRLPGNWHLVRKEDNVIVLCLTVRDGEQPYYVARHVGTTNVESGVSNETINYGIGKKRLDGQVDRAWVLANGTVFVGEEIEDFSLDLLRQGLLNPDLGDLSFRVD